MIGGGRTLKRLRAWARGEGARRLSALVASSILAAASTGCIIGGGDDTTASVFTDAGDAGAGDAGGGDARGSSGDATTLVGDAASDATVSDAASEAGPQPTVSLSSSPINFGAVPCGAPAATQTLALGNTGSSVLSVSAATTGTAFSVTPTTLSIAPGGSGTLTLSATVQGSAVAGAVLSGSLGLFTNDPSHGSLGIALSATPTGATIAFGAAAQSTVDFPSTLVGGAPTSSSFSLVNNGNAPATISITDPSPSVGFLLLSGGLSSAAPVDVAPNASVTGNVQFAPTTGAAQMATSSVSVTATALCGTSVSSVNFVGTGVLGSVHGWPSTLDFGSANCGGGAPAPQTFTLVNPGTTDEQVTDCHVVEPDGSSAPCAVGSGSGDASTPASFAANITAQTIPAGNGSLVVTVQAPPAAQTSSLQAVSASLAMTLDPPVSTPLAAVTLREEPTGAVLAFDSSSFGSFASPIVLLGPPATQTFNVMNTGNWPPSGGVAVSLGVVAGPGADAGVPADGGAAGPQSFTVLTSTLSVPVGGAAAERNDSLRFSPVAAGANVATLTLAVDPSTPLCAPLPSAALLGTGIGAGASVVPSVLTFIAPCNGASPPSQAFTVTNSGVQDMNWQLGAVTGAGAARYTVSASPAPGLLLPGQSSTVTVVAQSFLAMPVGGAPISPDPTALAAQVLVTTDVPFDSGHLVTLAEVPSGDQLALSASSLAFGQFPVGQTTLGQTFTVTNTANAGSADAHYSLSVQGAGAAAYTLTPSALGADLGAGATSAPESITFAPTSGIPYPATVTLTTTDAVLCAPLPSPIVLTGTGTSGHVSVSPGTLVFGDGPSGLVDCGSTAPAQSVTVSNDVAPLGGNQAFNVTSIALGKQGTGAPFSYTTTAATPPPFGLPVGNSFAITITPNQMPAVATPGDTTSFSDVLTITTDSPGDMPHTIPLTMQPRGAVIVQPPLPTTWSFGTIGVGSIGKFTTSFQNTGNAGVTVALTGLSQPDVFGVTLGATAASGLTPIVGQFTPTALDGTWSDQGTLVMTAAQGFCAAPPAPWQATSPSTWQGPTISLSGASNSNPPISISATAIAFPTTDCGNAPPAGQTLTLTNNTNQAQPFSVEILASVHPGTYSLAGPFATQDAGAATGTIPAMGVATIVVTPLGVVPGPGVVAGSYAATLEVDVATTPVTTYTVPLSWALNGAVLSLTPGGTPFVDGNAVPFYVADSTSGHLLPISNTGTAAVTLDFAVQPPGAFAFSPALPVSLLPGIGTSPQLTDLSATPACPPSPLTAGAATPIYRAGPVCQPLAYVAAGGILTALPAVTVQYCSGTF
jgi:hypothetical protein